jgi:hypothetical protein
LFPCDIGGAQLYIEVSSARDTQGTFRAHPCPVAVQLELLVKETLDRMGGREREREREGDEQRQRLWFAGLVVRSRTFGRF